MTEGDPDDRDRADSDPDPGEPDASATVTRADVEDARDRLAGVAHRTPLDISRTFAEMSGADSPGLKLEQLQRTGSFKIRGAYNAMARLSPVEREKVVAEARLALASWPARVGEVVDAVTAEGAELEALERARRTAVAEVNGVSVVERSVVDGS
nr:hypothetical protein [Halorubrum sp. Eb13]